MTTRDAIARPSPRVRLRVGNRYIWLNFQEHYGPAFYTNAAGTKLYEPEDESDPVWAPFGVWYSRYQVAQEKWRKLVEDSFL
jgi:hypothetical protein